MNPDFIVTAVGPSRTLAPIRPAAFLHLDEAPSAHEDRASTHVPIPGTQWQTFRPAERPRNALEDTQRRAIDGRLNVGENTVNNGEPEARKRRGGEHGRDWIYNFEGCKTDPFTRAWDWRSRSARTRRTCRHPPRLGRLERYRGSCHLTPQSGLPTSIQRDKLFTSIDWTPNSDRIITVPQGQNVYVWTQRPSQETSGWSGSRLWRY